MKTPQKRFLELKSVADRHRSIIDSPEFALSMDMALLQVVSELKKATDMPEAASEYWKLQGAIKYMETLESLANVPKPKAEVPDDNLIRTK